MQLNFLDSILAFPLYPFLMSESLIPLLLGDVCGFFSSMITFSSEVPIRPASPPDGFIFYSNISPLFVVEYTQFHRKEHHHGRRPALPAKNH